MAPRPGEGKAKVFDLLLSCDAHSPLPLLPRGLKGGRGEGKEGEHALSSVVDGDGVAPEGPVDAAKAEATA